MAVEELNCLAQALAVASMATSELQRFDLNVVLKKEPEARPKTCPVYDRVQQTVRYSQVLNNDQLDSLLSCEKDMRDIMGVARSRHVVCLDETRSAVIFGEDRDHLQTVVSRLVPRTLPSGRVRSYLAQMCAICSDLHERGFTLQGALQLSAFALDRCNHVFLLSSGGVQRANCWRPVAINPQYAAPEIIARTTQRQQRKLSTCSNCDSLFIADAYSVGICGLIMATGKRPFPVNVTRSFTAQDFLQQASNLVPEIPDDLDKDLRCLLFHLLERSPKRRIRVSDALHHPALHAFVGHLRRSPPVSTPGALSCMHTTSNNNNNNSDDLDGGRQVERRRTVDVEDSSNTEVILQKIDNTATSDHLNLNGAAMPASPEGSDQGDACDANEGLGDLECRGDASLADGSALVEFVHAIGAVSNALSDNNGNSSNNIDSSNNISQHLKSYEALSATVHQVSRVQAKGDDAAAAAAAAAALSNKVPSQECLPAERPESADKKRRHRKVVADVESPLSLLEFSAGRAEDSEPEDDDDGGVGRGHSRERPCPELRGQAGEERRPGAAAASDSSSSSSRTSNDSESAHRDAAL